MANESDVIKNALDIAKNEVPASKESAPEKNTRLLIKADSAPRGVNGIVIPRHMWEGWEGVRKNKKTGVSTPSKIPGLRDALQARADVYGPEHRDPLTLNKMGNIHKDILDEHFSKPIEEQKAEEAAALNRLRQAKFLSPKANTLDKSEKLDTVRHERDEQGRGYRAFAAKGVAGHAIYASGQGNDVKFHVITTCPGQTAGCGGGMSKDGIIDTSKGTCFAPVAEGQYPAASVRRALHEQAKFDPAMTKDWILAHTGSLREAARVADRAKEVLLFRPNVVDETDVSSRHVISRLNKQRDRENQMRKALAVADKASGKKKADPYELPPIIANSYGKTNELHDPENGYYVTHSNVGPKVKHGQSIKENIGRDKARVRSTILAQEVNGDDFTNEQGNKTPPKNSYLVTDVKRDSPMNKAMESAITHAKYWSTGRPQRELSQAEINEGPENHFDGEGNPTTPDKAHYGHTTLNGKRYDYQKQHILHPRLVQVGTNDDGTPHMIPTDSRFKDEEFLPKDRFRSKSGKLAGSILMTTPTTSTSNVGHETSFTHHVGQSHIEHAMRNNGEYEIDPPVAQEAAAGKEYVAPQEIRMPSLRKARASGGGVYDDFEDDASIGNLAFPEQNFETQRHLAHRNHHEDHEKPQKHNHGDVNHVVDHAMRLVANLTRR